MSTIIRLMERRRSSLKLENPVFIAAQLKQHREKSNIPVKRREGSSPRGKKKRKKRNMMQFVADSYDRANFTSLLSFSCHQY